VRLALVFGLALAVRGAAASRVAIIERDGIDYLAAAKRFAAGDVAGGLAHHYPPAYPASVALAASVIGHEPDEAIGESVSAISGALLAVAVALASGYALGSRAGLLAGLLAAVHPSCVEQAAKVTADPLFSALALGAVAALVGGVARRARSSFPIAGALAGASYLARPEGIVLVPVLAVCALVRRATPTRIRSRALDAFLVLLPSVLLAGAYVVAIKPHAGLNGGEAGSWKLTKKRELFLEAGGERVFPRGPDGARRFDPGGAAEVAGGSLERAAKQLALTLLEGNLLLGIVLGGVIVRWKGLNFRSGPPSDPAAVRVLGLAAAGSSLALLGTYALVRTDSRYAAILFAFALPFAGRAVDDVLELTVRSKKARAAILAAFFLTHLFVATRPRLLRKLAWREAGEECRALEGDVVASSDPRVAFYSGKRLVDLVPVVRRTDLDPDVRAREILALSHAGGARIIVLGNTHPDEVDLVRALSLRLKDEGGGRAPTREPFEREDTERVAVFLLGW
jgi:hypothetical protein